MSADFFALAPSDQAAERNTVRDPLRSIAIWELEDHHFAFDSSILLPTMTEDLAELIALLRANPGAPVAIFGHADPVGAEGYNKLLSGRRATALFALLTRKTALWDRLHANPIGGDDWRKDDQAGRIIRQHLGVTTPTPVPALFARYMDSLAVDPGGQPFVLASADFLGRGTDPRGKADLQGCSEFNPRLMFSAAEAAGFESPARHPARNEANATNRRVAVIVFAPGTEVEVNRWPCPRVNEGVDGCRKRFWSDAAVRRTFQPLRRERPAAEDTFACRFYDRLVRGAARERLLRTPLEVAVFVGSLAADPEVEELVALDSLGQVAKAFKPADRSRDASFRQFVIGPGLLPNPVQLRWRLNEFDIHVAGPCDPVKLRDALVTNDSETGQALIGTGRVVEPPPPPPSRRIVGDDLGPEDDQPFGREADRRIVSARDGLG
ncbi:MAG: OmpA family protein [Gemmatimonadales bacterium]